MIFMKKVWVITKIKLVILLYSNNSNNQYSVTDPSHTGIPGILEHKAATIVRWAFQLEY